MQKQQEIDPNARTAYEELEAEFAKEIILNNPHAGISIERLIELTQRENKK